MNYRRLMDRGRTALALAALLLLTAALARRPQVPRLSAIIKGGEGPPTIVLLHGYGSAESDWLPFANSLHFPARAHFILPRGPEAAARSDGAADGRGWWRLDLAPHMRRGVLGADLTAMKSGGIQNAARAVRDLLSQQGNMAAHPFILGGFSQGAMVAAQVAFLSSEPLHALVLLSGTIVNEALWKRHYARRRGLRVFISHGGSDPTLSFAVADRMRKSMTAAGIQVTWFPFDGGHEIPVQVLAALNDFLRDLPLGSSDHSRPSN
jgi:phospholipase/carboxylesterase